MKLKIHSSGPEAQNNYLKTQIKLSNSEKKPNTISLINTTNLGVLPHNMANPLRDTTYKQTSIELEVKDCNLVNNKSSLR